MKHTFFCFVFAFETGFLSVIKIKQRYPLRWFSAYSNMCITKKTNGCKLYPRGAIPPPPPVENYSIDGEARGHIFSQDGGRATRPPRGTEQPQQTGGRTK